jgi:hypothetical protein
MVRATQGCRKFHHKVVENSTKTSEKNYLVMFLRNKLKTGLILLSALVLDLINYN